VRQAVSTTRAHAVEGCLKVAEASRGGAARVPLATSVASQQEWARAVHGLGRFGGGLVARQQPRAARAEAKVAAASAPAFGSTAAGQALRRAMSTAPAGNKADGSSPGMIAAILAFPKAEPFWFNIIVATVKTSVADLITQLAVEKRSKEEIDWQRNMVFVVFGSVYLGGFQYWLQVNMFAKWFPGMNAFCAQTWGQKLRDIPGIIDVIRQSFVDTLFHMTFIYYPVFYVFKELIQGTSMHPVDWVTHGCHKYFFENFSADFWPMFSVWFPADLLCFSAPVWLRMPICHAVSLGWTMYVSFVRGGESTATKVEAVKVE